MTSILQYLAELDTIFHKHRDLIKHVIPPTKDLLTELLVWKRKFIKEYGEELLEK